MIHSLAHIQVGGLLNLFLITVQITRQYVQKYRHLILSDTETDVACETSPRPQCAFNDKVLGMPAIHTKFRSQLRSLSNRKPIDPPLRVVFPRSLYLHLSLQSSFSQHGSWASLTINECLSFVGNQTFFEGYLPRDSTGSNYQFSRQFHRESQEH